jgi:hypothetical protein
VIWTACGGMMVVECGVFVLCRCGFSVLSRCLNDFSIQFFSYATCVMWFCCCSIMVCMPGLWLCFRRVLCHGGGVMHNVCFSGGFDLGVFFDNFHRVGRL